MDPALYEAAMLGDTGFFTRIGGKGDQSIDLLHQKTPKDNNVLHIAAEYKQIKFLEKIPLDSQSTLFWATNKKGETPLHIAARVGCPEVVEFLINHSKTVQFRGPDEESGPADGEAHKKLLRMTNFDKDTALHAAARYGHCKVAILLIEADPQLCCFTNRANESPLFLAVCYGYPSIASSILIKSPVSPSFQGINGVTALHAAVTHRDKKATGTVALMVSKNPDIIKEVDALGWTPLHHAAFRGNLEAIRVLMQRDSSACYILDKSGMSALHVAAYAGHTTIMDDLIGRRPDTCDLLNAKGQTVLHSAVLGGQTCVIIHAWKTPKLGRLINEADEDGNTPLHLAVIHKKWAITMILIINPRVYKSAINKKFSKAADIIAADNIGTPEVIGGSRVFLFFMGRSIGVPFFQQEISRELKQMESPAEKDTSNTPPTITDNSEKLPKNYTDQVLKNTDTNLIVAALIATVTFAAPLTLPGGYKSDGTALLQENRFFQMFMVFNYFSFYTSTFVILREFWASASSFHINRATTVQLVEDSIEGLMAAFASGTLAFLSKGSTQSLAIILGTPIAMFFGTAVFRRLSPISYVIGHRKLISWLRDSSI